MVAQIAARLLTILRTTVLARLLAPEDFGLFGIAMLALSVLETFSQTGFQAALVQNKENVDLYLDTAWTIQVLRGMLLSVVFYSVAPYAAVFFGEPAVTSLVRVLSLSTLFGGLTNVGIIYFQKDLEFQKQFVCQLSSKLVDLVVSVTAALLLRDAWALVYGLLAGSFLRLVISYVIHPYRPAFRLNVARAKGLFHFGKWMFLFSILIFLINQGDKAFLGKALGATQLGFYQMAFQIGMLPASIITLVVSQVTFPAYAKLQDDPHRLQLAFRRTFAVTSLIVFPIASGLIIFAHQFTLLVLGIRWLPMVPLLQIHTLKGLVWALAGVTGGPLYMALGRPDINFKINLAQAVVLVLLLYPF